MNPGGGWGATKATAAVLWEQNVLFKGAAALYYMNKPGGFKCPSCAWPDPAPWHADPLVFCENGAKALAWEAHTVVRWEKLTKGTRVKVPSDQSRSGQGRNRVLRASR